MFVYHNVILIQTQIPIYAKYFSLQKTKKRPFVYCMILIISLYVVHIQQKLMSVRVRCVATNSIY